MNKHKTYLITVKFDDQFIVCTHIISVQSLLPQSVKRLDCNNDYQPQSRVDNAFGSIHLFRVFVRLH